MNAVHLIIPLAALWAIFVTLDALTRRHHRHEANRRQRIADHKAGLRMSPMREGWLIEHREREGRA